jgi:hypothetical protein
VKVAFEAGPLGLKLMKDKHTGFIHIEDASGQAAAKGLAEGDRLLNVEGTFLPIGVDQHWAAGKIGEHPRPVNLTFQKGGPARRLY